MKFNAEAARLLIAVAKKIIAMLEGTRLDYDRAALAFRRDRSRGAVERARPRKAQRGVGESEVGIEVERNGKPCGYVDAALATRFHKQRTRPGSCGRLRNSSASERNDSP